MDRRFLQVLQHVLDTIAFENVGTLRDFERLMDQHDRRRAGAAGADREAAAPADAGEAKRLTPLT